MLPLNVIKTRFVIFEESSFMSKDTFHKINHSTFLFQFDLLHLLIFFKWVFYKSHYHKLSNQIKSNQIKFKVGNVYLKETKNEQEAIYLTIFYNQ